MSLIKNVSLMHEMNAVLKVHALVRFTLIVVVLLLILL